ncbi:MAG: ABC transporter permease [Armatimonadota bacterium]|nr:ABC transporter permease [Armatimonadota bacterium]MDR7533251.1 ABC transporter permease [Armatimonadota bacterium]MDR7536956.1 ABC transporter permease [Armatimonadota bacterium]
MRAPLMLPRADEQATTQAADLMARPVVSQTAIVWRSLRRDRFAVAGLAVVLLAVLGAVFAPYLAPHDPYRVNAAARLLPPGTSGHLLGTDDIGRDIASRLLWGGRISLWVAFFPVLISGTLGLALGLASGYARGWIDQVAMRTLDVVLAFPSILLAIGIAAALGPGLQNVVMAIVVVSVPIFARLVRGLVLSVREREYVEAARCLGASTVRIVMRHVLPNVLPSVIVYATLETGRVVIFAAGLSFLGLGVQPPAADWGAMLAAGRQVLAVAPHVATIPGLVIFIVTLGFNLLGDGLRDALDPRLRGT